MPIRSLLASLLAVGMVHFTASGKCPPPSVQFELYRSGEVVPLMPMDGQPITIYLGPDDHLHITGFVGDPCQSITLMRNGTTVLDVWGQMSHDIVQTGSYQLYACGDGCLIFPFTIAPDPGTAVPLLVNVHARLQGACSPDTAWMRDDLRRLGLLPEEEPYSTLGYGGGGEHVASGVFGRTREEGVVDWVHVELRDPHTPGLIVSERNALLTRDGSVLDMDGTHGITFLVPTGWYYIALRHRNHLGVMTASPLLIAGGTPPVDLRYAPLFGIAAAVTAPQGGQALYAGNTTGDPGRPATLRYTGADNDRDPILVRIGGLVPTATTTGYTAEDVNMDGVVKYTGINNDRDIILRNTGGLVPTATRQEQLP